MKYFLLIFLVSTLLFMNCDGRKNRNESLRNAVSEFNNKQTQLDYITFSPKEYTEIETDTIIENTIKVHIKNYTLMDENVTISSTYNPRKTEYQRSFESEIIVYNAFETVFKTIINAKTFTDNDQNLFWNNATLQHAWVNQVESNHKNICILVSFVNPKTNSYRLYQLLIDETGAYNTSLKENHI